ncbi:MAG: glutaredoxin [Calditrichaeota bacterium]|nr:MAG: glutaredoxin [Calditrichota bacterium]
MFLDEQNKQAVIDRFKELAAPVKIIYFTQNLQIDKEVAQIYKIDRVPAIVIMGEEDYGIRFFGIPSGYEFISLLEAIVAVGQRDSGLSAETRQALAQIDQPVHMQVFVTPTCPYCPKAVTLAHRFAIENKNIRGDMVEATEFPMLSQRYEVMGVPRTVVNEKYYIDGGLPEDAFRSRLINILEAEKAEMVS